MDARKIIKKKQYLKNRQNGIMLRLQRNNAHQKVKHIYRNREFESGERILHFLANTDFVDTRINRFCGSIRKKITPGRRRTAKLTIPESFSFTKNPEETIGILRELTKIGLNNTLEKIYFDHSHCKLLDICASTVMDALILSIKDKHRNKRLELHGHIGDIKDVNEILAASGILKHLHISDKPIAGVECLDLLHNETSAEMTQKIIEYLSRCLGSQGFALKKEGRRDIGEMLSEILDNCNQHSMLREWFALGHYSKRDSQRRVRLVIFNFGKTIFESFSEKGSQRSMYQYLIKKAKGIRDKFPQCPSIEALVTLYALQDGISRFKGGKSVKPDRGSGTIKLISIFQAIGRNAKKQVPSMSITSGHAHIVFDNKYQIQTSIVDGVRKQIIAFNSTNDMTLPPNSNNVMDLESFFPGTVISMEFYLDREYLDEMVKGALGDGQSNNVG